MFSVRVVSPRKVAGYIHEFSSVWLLKQNQNTSYTNGHGNTEGEKAARPQH